MNRSKQIHFHREFTPVLILFLPINGKRIVPSLDAWQFLIKTTMAFQDMIMTKM